AVPIAGRRTAELSADAIPPAAPGGAAILEAARAPAILMSHSVSGVWSTGLPVASPAATAAILDAVLPPPALASRSVGGSWSRSLPGGVPGATRSILDAAAEADTLSSRPVTTVVRSLPKSTPAGAAVIRDARQMPVVPVTLTSRMVT